MLSKTNIRKWRDSIYKEENVATSPLNLKRGSARTLHLPPLEWTNFKSPPYSSKIINSGHTTVVKGTWYQRKKKPYLSGGPLLDQKYYFYHTHFHWGESEHALQGESFPMEVHNVFYNEKYKSYELALKEKDGIVIVVQFCRLLPELPHRSFTAPQVLHPSSNKPLQGTLAKNESPCVELNQGLVDRRNLRSHFTQLRTDRNLNSIQYNGPMSFKELKPMHYTNVPSKNNEQGRYFPKLNFPERRSQVQTKSADLTGNQSTVERINIFIDEIAKNIRFVRSVNTSKLIHAYCLDRLLKMFTHNFFFYLSAIRRPQTVHRITWIVDDRNFLFISKSQLRSFQMLRTVQSTKVSSNGRRKKIDSNCNEYLYYITGQPDNIQPIHEHLVKKNETLGKGDILCVENICQFSQQTDEIVPECTEEKLIKVQSINIVEHLVTGQISSENDLFSEKENSNLILERADEKALESDEEKLLNVTILDDQVTLDTVPSDETVKPSISFEMKNVQRALSVMFPPTIINNPSVPAYTMTSEVSLHRESTSKITNIMSDIQNSESESKEMAIIPSRNTSSSMMISDCKSKTTILELCDDDFYDYLKALFMDIANTIKFTIEVPYCSSLESDNTNVDGYSTNNTDDQTTCKDENSLFEYSASFISSKLTLSSTCERMLELFLPKNKKIPRYKRPKKSTKNKISIMRTKEKKWKLKNRFALKKFQNNVVNIMKVFVSHSNINVGRIFANLSKAQNSPGRQDSKYECSTTEENYFIDSAIFEPISIPSFATDIESIWSTADHEVDAQKDEENGLNDNTDISKHTYLDNGNETHSSIKSSIIDTKIPRPKHLISERKKINLNLSVKEPLSIKSTVINNISSSAPPRMSREKIIIGHYEELNITKHIIGKDNKLLKSDQVNQVENIYERNNGYGNRPKLKRLFYTKRKNVKPTSMTSRIVQLKNRIEPNVEKIKQTDPKANIGNLEKEENTGIVLTKTHRAKMYAKKYNKLKPRKNLDL